MKKLLAMQNQLPKIFFYIIFIFFSTYIFSQSDLQIKFDDLNYRNVGPTRGGRSTTVCGVVAVSYTHLTLPTKA